MTHEEWIERASEIATVLENMAHCETVMAQPAWAAWSDNERAYQLAKAALHGERGTPPSLHGKA